MIKLTLPNFAEDDAGATGLTTREWGDILVEETSGNGFLFGEGLGAVWGFEGDGVVGWVEYALSGEMTDQTPEGGRAR